MIALRWRRVGVVLLAVWLLADTSTFAFCGSQPVSASASTQVGTGHGSDTAPSADRQCFCCSHVEEVVRFELAFTEERVSLASPTQLSPPDISIRNSSPPPRF
jgi:hypothetical protein